MRAPIRSATGCLNWYETPKSNRAELMAELLALLDRGLDSHHLAHRIADIAEHREGDQPDRDQDADRRQEAAQDEGDHRGDRRSAGLELTAAPRHPGLGFIGG
jgi:hypothetical protein